MAQRLIENVIRIVIPSRERASILEHGALTLFPYATVTVAESEMDDYAPLFLEDSDRLVPHPDHLVGIAPIRQWVLDNFEEECIVFVDDDMSLIKSFVGYKYQDYTHPATAIRLLENAAAIAKGAGVSVFGFNQGFTDIRKFTPTNPFLLTGWVGGVVGIVGRRIRYDTGLLLRADIDLCLQCMLVDRATFVENRFSFAGGVRFGMPGGNARNRSAKRNEAEINYLKEKWGRFIAVRQAKGTTILRPTVPRRQGFVKVKSDYS